VAYVTFRKTHWLVPVGGNFEHLFTFEANLKIHQIFFTTSFYLKKAEPNIRIGVAKQFIIVLQHLVELFKKMGCVRNYPHVGYFRTVPYILYRNSN